MTDEWNHWCHNPHSEPTSVYIPQCRLWGMKNDTPNQPSQSQANHPSPSNRQVAICHHICNSISVRSPPCPGWENLHWRGGIRTRIYLFQYFNLKFPPLTQRPWKLWQFPFFTSFFQVPHSACHTDTKKTQHIESQSVGIKENKVLFFRLFQSIKVVFAMAMPTTTTTLGGSFVSL